MLFSPKKICLSLFLLFFCSIAMAGKEGTWRFTAVLYSISSNGVPLVSITYAQAISDYGLSEADLTFEQEYSDQWLTPQTFTSNESGDSTTSTMSYNFSSDSSGKFIVQGQTSASGQTTDSYFEYSMVKISGGSSTTDSNNSTTTTQIANTVSEIPVTSSQGSVFEITPTATSSVDNSVSDNSSIFTGAGSTIVLPIANSQVTVQENSLVTLSPAVSNGTQKKVSLLRGKMDLNVSTTSGEVFELKTPVVNIKIANTSSKRATEQANFSTQYSQSGTVGTSTISVTSGSVQVTNRNGNVTTLSAGQTQTFNNQVPRTTWVQPADSAFLFGGETNILAWMRYQGAVGYVIEYTFPSPSFAEENPSSMEFAQQKVLIPAVNFQTIEDVEVMEMVLPASLNGLVVEARLFPVDAQGNILTNSVASDKGTFSFKAK